MAKTSANGNTTLTFSVVDTDISCAFTCPDEIYNSNIANNLELKIRICNWSGYKSLDWGMANSTARGKVLNKFLNISLKTIQDSKSEYEVEGLALGDFLSKIQTNSAKDKTT